MMRLLIVGLLLLSTGGIAVPDEDLSQYWPNTGAVSAPSRPGVNLLRNGDFEKDGEGWHVIQGDPLHEPEVFGREGWHIDHGVEIVHPDAAAGSSAVHLTSAGETWGPGIIPVETLSLRPNTTYRGAVRVKGSVKDARPDSSGYVEFIFFQMDAEKKRLGYNWTTIQSRPGWQHDDWQTLSLEFTPRSPRVRYGALYIGTYNCIADVLIDDLKWEELQPPPLGRTEPVEGVALQGHPSLMDMKVTGLRQTGQDFEITTTGAKFQVNAAEGVLSADSLLDAERPVCRLKFDVPLSHLQVRRNDQDMAVLENDYVAFSVNGDSLLLVSFAGDTKVTLTNLLAATYYKQGDGNILLLDPRGGYGFYPSKDDGSGYLPFAPLSIPEDLGQPAREAQYRFRGLARVGLGLVPPKPFDWEKSWNQLCLYPPGNWAPATGYVGDNMLERFQALGVTDMISTIGKAQPANWLRPEYLVDPEGLKDLSIRAGRHGIRLLTYINVGRYGDYDVDSVIADMAGLVNDYGLKGYYLDGLYRNDDWLKSYDFLRKLRDVVGADGVIFIHNTISPVSIDPRLFCPTLDAWGDYLYRGEGVHLKDPNDPYYRYCISSYHVSNVPVAYWFNANFTESHAEEAALWENRWNMARYDQFMRFYDQALDYNLRTIWNYPSWNWETGVFVQDSFLHYWLPMVQVREARWRAGEWKPIQDRE